MTDIEQPKNSAKGSKGLIETSAFAVQFPLHIDRAVEKIIKAEDFDSWADASGFYSTDCEQATLLDSRNKLRKKINNTASSAAWLATGQFPFSIEVYDFGKTYKVHHADDAFTIKANKLPRQVQSFATTKRRNIQALLGSIDLDQLSPAMQMRISGLDREVDRFLRGIDYQTTELNREYDAIAALLKSMVDQKLITPENHAIAQLLGTTSSEDEDDE